MTKNDSQLTMVNYQPLSNQGLTLIELLLTMGIISVLMTISSLLLLNLIPRASLKAESEVFISQLKHQQLKAMTGAARAGDGADEPSLYGIYIQDHAYTLFSGQVYDPLSADNFEVIVEEPISLSTSFPQQQIVFSAVSGEVQNFDANNNTITISDSQTNRDTIININQYGVITQ